jgi:hypothetical protein
MNLFCGSILSDFPSPQIFRRLNMIRLALTFVCWALMIGRVYPQPDVASAETSSSQAVTAARPVPADAGAAPVVSAPSESPISNPGTSVAADKTATVEKSVVPGVATSGAQSAVKADKKSKTVVKPAKRALQLDHLYVVEGCEACNGLQAYLRRVGVKLTVSRVGNSPYSTFPTVVYSDGTTDNGERVYSKSCQFPKSVAVDECRSGG